MVSGSTFIFEGDFLGFHGWKQGIQSGLRPSQPDLRPSQPASQASGFRPGWLGLRPGWLGLRPGWMAQRGEWTDGQTDEQTDGQTENLPILQDFVPYRGRCPKNRQHRYRLIVPKSSGVISLKNRCHICHLHKIRKVSSLKTDIDQS